MVQLHGVKLGGTVTWYRYMVLNWVVQIHDVKLGGTVTWYRYMMLNWVVQLHGTDTWC